MIPSKHNSMRKGEVECLRCLLMFFVVLWHGACHGIWSSNESSCAWMYVGLMWHVPAFVAISGWYGISFRWSKFFRLYGLVVFYSLLGYGYEFFFLKQPWHIPHVVGGWFVPSYLALMLLSPIVNSGVDSLVIKGPRIAVRNWSLVAVLITVGWLPFVRTYSGITFAGLSVLGGGTFFTVLFVYLSARLFSCIFKPDFLHLKRLFLVFAGCIVGCIFSVLVSYCKFGVLNIWTAIEFNGYNAPHIWMFAIAVVAFAANRLRLPTVINRVGGWLAPSMFAVYLFHECMPWSYDLYRIPQAWLSRVTAIYPVCIILICAICVFAVSIMADMARRLLVVVLMGISRRCLNKLRGGDNEC